MRTVRVDTGKPYDICIERGILDKCGEYAKALSKAEKVTIISDSNVAPLYMDRVKASLEKEGFNVATHIFKAGEEQKHQHHKGQNSHKSLYPKGLYLYILCIL